jgi:hypothetical protein
VQWKILRLAETTGGGQYGETALPVADKLKQLFPTLKASNMPSVVWICDVSDDKSVQKINRVVMQNEPVGIALKRFNCFRVNVLDMPEGDLKKKYEKEAQAFYFFDPAVKQVARLAGKRANSLSAFASYMEKTWNASFKMKLKVYQKAMKDILDRLDKLDGQKQVLNRQRARLAERPNPAAQRALDAKLKKFEEERSKIEADQQAINEKCVLKPQFLPKKEDG